MHFIRINKIRKQSVRPLSFGFFPAQSWEGPAYLMLDTINSMLPILYPSDSEFRDELGFDFLPGKMR